MYVYIQCSDSSYEVGFYTPKGDWIVESTYASKDLAAKRVNYLNGGTNVHALNAAALYLGSK